MYRALKFCGRLLLNILVAMIATGILETTIGKAFKPHAFAAVLWKEWILSALCAAAVGFGMWRTWRQDEAKWVWVLPAVLWFGLVLPTMGHGSLWGQMSGAGCSDGTRSVECRNFFLFTILLLRSVSYSIGAFVCSAIFANKTRFAESSETGSLQ